MISQKCPKCGELKEAKSPGLFACRNCKHHFYVGMEKKEPIKSERTYFSFVILSFILSIIIIGNINPVISILIALAYYAAFGYFIIYNIICDKLAIDVAGLLRASAISCLVAMSLFKSLS